MTSSVPEKSHSSLGASIAARWIACPGSVALAATCPPSPTTKYAKEGTAAHALAELCLKKNVDPTIYVGMTIEEWVVDDDMAENVRVFVDHCRAITNPGDPRWVEYKFNLSALCPPSPMWGTADYVTYDVAKGTLRVADLKYGMGVVVEATNNKQLRYYGLGAAIDIGAQYDQWGDVQAVELWIVQPRASHPDGVARSDFLTYPELLEFGAELMAAAHATLQPGAPLKAGDWCKWCPAAGACPEQRRVAVELAQIDFTAIEPLAPKPPELLSDTELAKVLAIAPMVSDWLTAARMVVERRLASGESFPGYKLVAKRAVRSWTDPADTALWLEAQGFAPDEIFVNPKLKSPAQIEKLDKYTKKEVASRVSKISSGYVMVPASDPRPEIASIAAVEFTALPAGEDE